MVNCATDVALNSFNHLYGCRRLIKLLASSKTDWFVFQSPWLTTGPATLTWHSLLTSQTGGKLCRSVVAMEGTPCWGRSALLSALLHALPKKRGGLPNICWYEIRWKKMYFKLRNLTKCLWFPINIVCLPWTHFSHRFWASPTLLVRRSIWQQLSQVHVERPIWQCFAPRFLAGRLSVWGMTLPGWNLMSKVGSFQLSVQSVGFIQKWTIRHNLNPSFFLMIGNLRAINPENGFFGVAPGTSAKTNPNAMETITKNTVFTNVAETSDGGVYWEGMDQSLHEGVTITSWKNTPWSSQDGKDLIVRK